MFTGLIEEMGTVLSLKPSGDSLIAEYGASIVLEGTVKGDSIAVNGVCQTVTSLTENSFRTDISGETISKTTAGKIGISEKVNLERAMKLGDRIGGHLVQGHVNERGIVKRIEKRGSMYRLSISLPRHLMKYVISEGSIAVDGISLTVADLDRQSCAVALQIIPHTFEMTVLQYRKIGDEVNIETDLFGRYAESIMAAQRQSEINMTNLIKWGY